MEMRFPWTDGMEGMDGLPGFTGSVLMLGYKRNNFNNLDHGNQMQLFQPNWIKHSNIQYTVYISIHIIGLQEV